MLVAKGVLKILPHELRLDTTLKCGQSFRWRKINPDDTDVNSYRCSLKGRVVTLTQYPTEIQYSSVFPPGYDGIDDTKEMLHDYLSLDIGLEKLYKEWSARDEHFRAVSVDYLGLRMLRQDPLENILSFICSSNNNISRITSMVQNLCTNYGQEIATIDGEPYHAFPELENLLHSSLTEELRALGFGYRAKFIAGTATQLAALPKNYLLDLRQKDYPEAHSSLLQFIGVGAKVADCVCLMSLDKPCAVPVDTHVLQIAKRDYKFKSKGTAMSKLLYDQIKSYFIELWGPYAGWAHSVLFTADLKAFQMPVVSDRVSIKSEVTTVKEEELICNTKSECVQVDTKHGIVEHTSGEMETIEVDVKPIQELQAAEEAAPLDNTLAALKRRKSADTHPRSKRQTVTKIKAEVS